MIEASTLFLPLFAMSLIQLVLVFVMASTVDGLKRMRELEMLVAHRQVHDRIINEPSAAGCQYSEMMTSAVFPPPRLWVPNAPLHPSGPSSFLELEEQEKGEPTP